MQGGMKKSTIFMNISIYLGTDAMLNTDILPTTSSLNKNICLLIHYSLQCAKLPNLKVIGG